MAQQSEITEKLMPLIHINTIWNIHQYGDFTHRKIYFVSWLTIYIRCQRQTTVVGIGFLFSTMPDGRIADSGRSDNGDTWFTGGFQRMITPLAGWFSSWKWLPLLSWNVLLYFASWKGGKPLLCSDQESRPELLTLHDPPEVTKIEVIKCQPFREGKEI